MRLQTSKLCAVQAVCAALCNLYTQSLQTDLGRNLKWGRANIRES